MAEKMDYAKLFDPSVNHGMFFSVLRDIIHDNYQCFDNIFQGEDIKLVKKHLSVINTGRQAPAHSFEDNSANWTDEEFYSFRESMSWLENILKDFGD